MTDCDTREGLEAMASDLEGLNRIMAGRREAANGGSGRLSAWVIGGKWYLDGCGNWSRIIVPDSRALPDVPAVATDEEFFRFMAASGLGESLETARSTLPRPRTKCRTCDGTFSAASCWGASIEGGYEDVDGGQFVGRTLSEVDAELARWDSGVWFVPSERAVRNQRLIDTAAPDGDEEKGYVGTGPAFRTDMGYVVKEGDILVLFVRRFEHRICRDDRFRRERMDLYRGILADSGLPHGDVREIPNGYRSDSVLHGPWARTTSFFGDVTIGMRRHVYEIAWAGEVDGSALFKGEGVTCGKGFVHAWGRDKAVEYVRKVFESALESRKAATK